MRETLIIDAHVHIYPKFNLSRMIRSSLKNFVLSQRTSDNRDEAVKIWLLSERSDCKFFQDLPSMSVPGFSFERTSEEETLVVKDSATKEPLIYILAGRQIISTESLEICALASTFHQHDRTWTAMEILKAVTNVGGMAAINWAPGKWFGKRGKIVKKLLETLSPQELFISDTTMRPTIWPTPGLMAAAQKQGFRVLSGSDPLPFSGEEDVVASYAFLASGDFNDKKPAHSVKSILRDPKNQFTVCGSRSGPVTFAKRQTKIMMEKKG